MDSIVWVGDSLHSSLAFAKKKFLSKLDTYVDDQAELQ